MTVEVGRRFPLHAGSSSTCILAFLPTAQQEEVLAGRLDALTPRTIVDPSRLRDRSPGGPPGRRGAVGRRASGRCRLGRRAGLRRGRLRAGRHLGLRSRRPGRTRGASAVRAAPCRRGGPHLPRNGLAWRTTRTRGPAMSDALAGLKVLDVSTLFAGPLGGHDAGRLRRRRDQGRAPPRRPGALPRGEQGRRRPLVRRSSTATSAAITLYLGSPEGQDVFRRLVADADVVIENFRPGTLERWGLGYPELLGGQPGSRPGPRHGFGQIGPYAASSGIRHARRGDERVRRDHRRARRSPDPAAVRPRRRHRRAGRRVRHDDGASCEGDHGARPGHRPRDHRADADPARATADGLGPARQIQERSGNRSSNNAPRNTYLHQGRPLGRGVDQRAEHRRAGHAARRPSGADRRALVRLRRGARAARRRARRGGRRRGSRGTTATRWSRPSRRPQAAVAPIYDVRDVVADPQYEALGSLVRVPDPELGSVPMPERPLPALRDAGAGHQRRPALGAAHRGGAGRDRHRRRPAGRAAAAGGGVSVPALVALRAGPPSRPGPQGACLGGRRCGDRPRGRRAGRGEGRGPRGDSAVRDRTLPRTKPLWVRVNPSTEAVGRADVDALAGTPVDGRPRAAGRRTPRTSRASPSRPVTTAAPVCSRPPWRRAGRPRWPGAPVGRAVSLGEADLAADLMVPPTRALDWARRPRRRRVAAPPGSPSPIHQRVDRPRGPRRAAHLMRDRPGPGLLRTLGGPPAQIPVVHGAFTPSPDEVAEARAVLAIARRGPSPGRGGRPRRAGPLRRPRRGGAAPTSSWTAYPSTVTSTSTRKASHETLRSRRRRTRCSTRSARASAWSSWASRSSPVCRARRTTRGSG